LIRLADARFPKAHMSGHFLKGAARCLAHPGLAINYLRWRLGFRTLPIGAGTGQLASFSSFSQWWYYKNGGPLSEAYLKFVRGIVAGPGEIVCFDVGANIGLHSIAWSLLASNARIFAFEPLPDNRKNLRANLAANKIQNVKMVNAAVSDKSGQVRFRLNSSAPQNAKMDEGVLYPCADVADVDSVCLDEFADAEGIGTITLLKIDTEGAEARVLRGARHLLQAGRIRFVIAEFGPGQLQDFGDSVDTFFSALRVGNGALHLLLSDGSLSPALTELQSRQLSCGDVVFVASPTKPAPTSSEPGLSG